MSGLKRLIRFGTVIALAIGGQMFSPSTTEASGISIDAGLTPAANRWIVRSQMRFMERDNNPASPSMRMRAYMFPVMAAYGLRSDAMIMVRQAYVRREMTMMNESTIRSGLGDLLILGKYRLIRINTPTYTLGIAPTLGLELPTGADAFTSDSYDLRLGTFLSGRMEAWRLDLNLTYVWNGMALTGDSDIDPGDEVAVEAALSRQFSMGRNADLALAPVLETSYQTVSADRNDDITVSNTGGSLLLVAPGLKLTRGSFILEGLIQFPVWQEYDGTQTERSTGLLLGVRLMN